VVLNPFFFLLGWGTAQTAVCPQVTQKTSFGVQKSRF